MKRHKEMLQNCGRSPEPFFRRIVLYHRHLSIIVCAKYLKIMAKASKLQLPGLKDDIFQAGPETGIIKTNDIFGGLE